MKVQWDCNRKVVGWEWRGTYVWHNAEPLPQLRRAKKLSKLEIIVLE